jgi:tetratricopeptide (TPR) repeat protein
MGTQPWIQKAFVPILAPLLCCWVLSMQAAPIAAYANGAAAADQTCLGVHRVRALGKNCTVDLFEELSPDYPFAYLAAEVSNRVEQARTLPQCFAALYNAAAALQGSLQLQAAVNIWSRTVQLPANALGSTAKSEAWFHLGVARHSLGDEHGAIDALLHAIVVCPEDNRSWFRLGLVLHGKSGHGPSSAVRALLAALRLQREARRQNSTASGGSCARDAGTSRRAQSRGSGLRCASSGAPSGTQPGTSDGGGEQGESALDSRGGGDEVLYYILQETLREARQDEVAANIAREGVRAHPGSTELFCRMFVAAVQVCDWRGWRANAERLQSLLGYVPAPLASSRAAHDGGAAAGSDGGWGELGRAGVANLNCVTAWDSLYMPIPADAVGGIARALASDLQRLVSEHGRSLRRRNRQRWMHSIAMHRGGDVQGGELLGRDGADESIETRRWLVPLPLDLHAAPGGSVLGPRVLRVGYVSSHLNHWALGRDMLHVFRLHRVRDRVQAVCISLSRAGHGAAAAWQARIREQCGSWIDAQDVRTSGSRV